MAFTVVYSQTATREHTTSWAGEDFTIRPIPDGVPGIRVLAEQIGLDSPEKLADLAPVVEQAARDAERLPQVRTLLRHGAAELHAAAALVPGDEQRWKALTAARTHLVRAWQTLPGAWGFSLTPDGGVSCGLCGRDEPGDGTGYRPEAEAKAWYAAHAEICTPAPQVKCRECPLCGYCRTPRTPVHRCSLCTCDRE